MSNYVHLCLSLIILAVGQSTGSIASESKGVQKGTFTKVDLPKSKTYYLHYVPHSYNPKTPAPAFIFYHAQEKQPQFYQDKLKEVSEKFGMVLVMPKSIGTSWKLQTCRAISIAALHSASKRSKLNPKKFYYGGHSVGTNVAFLNTLIYGDRSKGVIMIGATRFFAPVGPARPKPPVVVYYGEKDPQMSAAAGINIKYLKIGKVKTTVITRPNLDNSSCPKDVIMEAFEFLINKKKVSKSVKIPEPANQPQAKRKPKQKPKDYEVSKIKIGVPLNTAPELSDKTRHWFKIDLKLKARLTNVHFPTANKGWAVGDQGLILHTTDGGKTWQRQESGLKHASLHGLYFSDENNGWACGGIGDGPAARGHLVGGRPQTAAIVLKTTDGGKHWIKRWGPTNFHLTEIFALKNNSIVTISHGGSHPDGDTIVSTNDGKSWKTRSAFRGLRDLQFIDQNTGYAVGSRLLVGFSGPPKDPLFVQSRCQIIKSTNGGKSWKPLKHPDLEKQWELTGISFVDTRNGWACGMNGYIFHTADAGKTWVKQESKVTTYLSDIWGSDANHAWAVGKEGLILYTEDAGTTWSKIKSGTQADLSSLFFTSPSHGVAVGENGIILYYHGILEK